MYKHRCYNVSTGSEDTKIDISDGSIGGVRTDKTSYAAPVVVNCAGAWAGNLGPQQFPTRPVKGQMLSVAGGPRNTPRHVISSPEVYAVPRSDGRVLIGGTVDEL